MGNPDLKKKKKRKSKTHGPNHLSWTAYHQNNPFINHPGTTVRIPLNMGPAPFLPDGLYNNEDNNLLRITTNASTCPLQLRNNQPTSGVTAQLLDHEDNRKTPKIRKITTTNGFS